MFAISGGTTHGCPQTFFQKRGAMSIFCLSFSIADNAMLMDVHETIYPLYSQNKMLHVTATVTKMSFGCSNSQVYYDNSHNTLSADFKSRPILFVEPLPWSFTKEALQWSFMQPHIMTLFYLARLVNALLRNKSCKRLGSRRKLSITLSKNFACLSCFFSQ